MVTTTGRFTEDDYRLLPEGAPVQLLDGCLLSDPAPRYGHQRVVGAAYRFLCARFGPDRVVVSPVDVWIDRHNVLQPDVLVARAALPESAERVGIPLLVVEVLSPHTADRDRGIKAATYLRAGVAEVWLADPDARTVEVRTAREGRSSAPSGEVFSAVLDGPLRPADFDLAVASG